MFELTSEEIERVRSRVVNHYKGLSDDVIQQLWGIYLASKVETQEQLEEIQDTFEQGWDNLDAEERTRVNVFSSNLNICKSIEEGRK